MMFERKAELVALAPLTQPDEENVRGLLTSYRQLYQERAALISDWAEDPRTTGEVFSFRRVLRDILGQNEQVDRLEAPSVHFRIQFMDLSPLPEVTDAHVRDLLQEHETAFQQVLIEGYFSQISAGPTIPRESYVSRFHTGVLQATTRTLSLLGQGEVYHEMEMGLLEQMNRVTEERMGLYKSSQLATASQRAATGPANFAL